MPEASVLPMATVMLLSGSIKEMTACATISAGRACARTLTGKETEPLMLVSTAATATGRSGCAVTPAPGAALTSGPRVVDEGR
ncbi:hypothetical protein D3C86_1247370 [compost metagenome]